VRTGRSSILKAVAVLSVWTDCLKTCEIKTTRAEMSTLEAGKLFNVKGMVFVVSGGGSGNVTMRKLAMTLLTVSQALEQ
jgi:hypothetical protein